MLATIRSGRSCLRPSYLKFKLRRLCSSADANPEGKSIETTPSKTGGFARAFEKQSEIVDTQENVENQTFATLLRNSKLMNVSSWAYSIFIQKNIVNYRFLILPFGLFSFSWEILQIK